MSDSTGSSPRNRSSRSCWRHEGRGLAAHLWHGLVRRDSYLVMFGGFFPGVLADADDLERAFPLRPVARFADGIIYQRAGL